jgi:HD-like signal output (HDOD) protein/CheY-like chemotaxis protein
LRACHRGGEISECAAVAALMATLARCFTLMKRQMLLVESGPEKELLAAAQSAGLQDQWATTSVPDGPQALAVMEKSSFDVVVSDFSADGGRDGQLLGEIKARQPQAARVIVSTLGEQEHAARSVGDTHQFLAKPLDSRLLTSMLDRVCGLDKHLKNEKLKAIIGNIQTLPSFPSIYIEIMKELRSPNSSIESIAGVLAKDPAMTAKILQIVNSAAIGLARQISSPFEAVEFLGLGTVRSLVLSAHVFGSFERPGLKKFAVNNLWQHTMSTGMLARRIMHREHAAPEDAEDACIAGMLHDAGKLMFATSLPDQFAQALALAAEKQIPLHDAEMEILGANHAGAAAYLLGLWGLPATIVEAVAFHHAPQDAEKAAFGPLAAVHVANILEHEFSKAQKEKSLSTLNLDYLESIGMKDRYEDWRILAERMLHPDED